MVAHVKILKVDVEHKGAEIRDIQWTVQVLNQIKGVHSVVLPEKMVLRWQHWPNNENPLDQYPEEEDIGSVWTAFFHRKDTMGLPRATWVMVEPDGWKRGTLTRPHTPFHTEPIIIAFIVLGCIVCFLAFRMAMDIMRKQEDRARKR